METFLYDDFYHNLEERHWWFVGRRRIVSALIDRYAARPRRILDAGCGTGYTASQLAARGEVHAFDSAPEAVKYAGARGISARQGELTAIPYDDGLFDLVTALDVLEHVDDDRVALGELRRVLRPGGILVLTVPAYRFLWSPHDEVNRHKRRYTAKELREKAEACGFEVLKLSYYNALLFPAIFALRVLRSLFPARREEDRSDFSIAREGIVNSILTAILSAEARILPRLNFPFGVSLVGVARRP